jgi:tetratricopeptide (TPR) repeat protein
MGLPALAAGLLCLGVLFVFGIRRLRTQPDRRLQVIGFGALAGCGSLLLHSLVEFNFFIPSNALLFVICAVLVVVSGQTGREDLPVVRFVVRIDHGLKVWAYTTVAILVAAAWGMVAAPVIGSIWLYKAQEAGEISLASVFLRRARLIDPGNPEVLARIGGQLLWESLGPENRARKAALLNASASCLGRAHRTCSIRNRYSTQLAYSLERLGRTMEAEEAFRRAVQLSPMNPATHYNLGSFLLRQGRLGLSLGELRRFLELGGDEPVVVLEELWTHTQDYRQLGLAVPDTGYGRRKLARFLLAKGKTLAAERELAQAFSLEPTALNALAHLMSMGDRREAIAVGEEYRDRFPEDIEIGKRVADLYFELGKHDEGISAYQSLIREHPGRIGLRTSLSNVLLDAGRPEDALSTMLSACEEYPDKASLFASLAQIYRAIGRRSVDELRARETAVRLEPERWEYRYALGQAYKEHEMYTEAVAQWRLCLAIDPGRTQCMLAIERLHIQMESSIKSFHSGR